MVIEKLIIVRHGSSNLFPFLLYAIMSQQIIFHTFLL